jgi:hypothetical protein
MLFKFLVKNLIPNESIIQFSPNVIANINEHNSFELIKVTIPKGARSGPIQIRTGNGKDDVNFGVLPFIDRIEPDSARPGQTISIIGDNYSYENFQIKFNGNATEHAEIASTKDLIKVIVPENIKSGLVTVKTKDGNSNPKYLRVINEETPNSFLQFIHNSPDPQLKSINVFINGELREELKNLEYRFSSPFIEVTNNAIIDIGLEESTSPKESVFYEFCRLKENDRNIIILTGVLNPENFDQKNGNDIKLDIVCFPIKGFDSNNLGMYVSHGVPDLNEIYLTYSNVKLTENIGFNKHTDLIQLQNQAGGLLTINEVGKELPIETFNPQFERFSEEVAIAYLSGFYQPKNNQNGPELGIWIAQAEGGPSVSMEKYRPPLPIVTGLDPPFAPSGYSLTITGSNFKSFGQDQPTVFVGANKAEIIGEVTNEKIVVEIPNNLSAHEAILKVKTFAGESAGIPYIIINKPEITKLLPGRNLQGGALWIIGQELGRVNQVYFDNYLTTVIDKSAVNKGLIGLNVPVGQTSIGEIPIKVAIEVSGHTFESNSVKFSIASEVVDNPPLPNELNVQVPNLPSSYAIPPIQNRWWMENHEEYRFALNPNGDMNPDGTRNLSTFLRVWPLDPFTSDYDEKEFIVGSYNPSTGFVKIQLPEPNDENNIKGNLRYGGVAFEGYFDAKFWKGSELNTPFRMILTPVESGNQIEMIYPGVLEGIEPKKYVLRHEYDSPKFKIKGKYFERREHYLSDQWPEVRDVILDGENLNPWSSPIEIIYIENSLNTIEIIFKPNRIQPGKHTIQLSFEGDLTNVLEFEIE